MKANIPEKIYLATTKEVQNLDTSFVGVAHSNPKDIVEPIEYARTDAFIEKLECWMNENFYQYAGEFAEGILAQFDRTEDAIEDFRKYMEG